MCLLPPENHFAGKHPGKDTESKSPPLEYSMSADQEKKPYAEYTVQVEAEGYKNEEAKVKPINNGG